MEKEKQNAKEVFTRMVSLCSRSEQCTPEIRKKIKAAGLNDDAANKMIEKLIEERFIDDERYIRSYVSDKFKFNRWGKIKISYYLKMKGLPDELIRQGLEKIDEESYRDALIATMKEKARTVKKKNKYEKMGQVIRFTQNRGYEPELIHRYLHEISI